MDVDKLVLHHDKSKRARKAVDYQGPWTTWCESASAELMRIHSNYLDDVKDQYILLQNRIDETYLALPYVVRGMAEYTRRSQKRANKIMKEWKRKRLPKGMFITFSPRQVGSINKLREKIHDLWPKFMNYLRMYKDPEYGHYPYRGEYVWAVEPNERHYAHYHMLLGRRVAKGPLAQLTLKWWQSNGVDIEDPGVDVQHAKKDPKTYVLKYVTKGSKDPIWCAMLWLSRARAWGASRGLGYRRLTHNRPLPNWTPATVGPIWIDRVRIPVYDNLGIIDGGDLIKYIDEGS